MIACHSLQLQGCAKRSVSLLDCAAAGQHTFDDLFLTRQSPLTTYDYLFHVNIPQPKAAQLQTQDVPRWVQAEKKLLGLVKQVRCFCIGEALKTLVWLPCSTAAAHLVVLPLRLRCCSQFFARLCEPLDHCTASVCCLLFPRRQQQTHSSAW